MVLIVYGKGWNSIYISDNIIKVLTAVEWHILDSKRYISIVYTE